MNENIIKFYEDLKNNNVNYSIPEKDDYKNLYNFFKFYKSIKKEFEISINDINKSFIKDDDNELVKKSVNELIRMNSDGKFLRASLIALGYLSNIKNPEKDKYLPLAVAYETFQTSILIHDDIIDNASKRRGKITIPSSYSNDFNKYKIKDDSFNVKKNHIANSLGICIGDLGFYLASKIVIDNYCDEINFHRILDLYNKIVINTIKGEIIDVQLPFDQQYKGKSITKEKDIMEIYKLKTAWYSIIGPYSLGMVLADATNLEIEQMERVLYDMGIAFQIKDDILGIYGDENEIGKSSSSDISEFKQTLLYSYIIEKKPEYLNELHKYYGKETLTVDEINKVKNIFVESGAKEYAEKQMENMFNESKILLNNINFFNEEYKSILYGFIIYLNLRNK